MWSKGSEGGSLMPYSDVEVRVARMARIGVRSASLKRSVVVVIAVNQAA